MNETNAGVIVCVEMLKQVPNAQHILVIQYEFGNFEHEQRAFGCQTYMESNGVQVTNVAPGTTVDLGSEDSKSQFVAGQLEADPSIDMIYPTTSFFMDAVLAGMEQVGKSLPTASIDILPNTIDLIEEGRVLLAGGQGATQAMLSLYASGRTSGIMVNNGVGVSHAACHPSIGYGGQGPHRLHEDVLHDEDLTERGIPSPPPRRAELRGMSGRFCHIDCGANLMTRKVIV
jgi:hypothetical protein